MSVPDSAETPISESRLRALYSLLPGALRQNLYGPKFSKRLQVWRESLHPCGKTDIRKLDGFDDLTVKVNLGDRLGCDIYYGFFQEYFDYSLFMALLKPQDIVVDIGSNFGMYALGAAKRLSSKGRVVAFEPDIRSMSLLQENVRLNNFEELVTCIDVCIGSHDGEVGFYAAADPSFSGIHDTHRSEKMSHLMLPIRRLDSVMHEIGISQVHQIKIDVEGAEYEVLEGATEILANSNAIVMLEISSKNLDVDRSEKLSASLGRLEAQGYVSFSIDHEASSAKLIIEESLKDIVQKTGAGQTKNHFLVKQGSEKINFIQDAFKRLNMDSTVMQKENLFRRLALPAINQEKDDQQPTLDQAGTGELSDLQAILWAVGVEKQAIIDSYRQSQIQFRALESEHAKTSEEMLAQCGENAAIKASLAKLTLDYRTLRKDEHGHLPSPLDRTETDDLARLCHDLWDSTQVANGLYQKACIQVEELRSEIDEESTKLVETGRKLAARESEVDELRKKLAVRTEEKAAFKSKLVENSKELAALKGGFLGLLFRIKKRLLNRGADRG